MNIKDLTIAEESELRISVMKQALFYRKMITTTELDEADTVYFAQRMEHITSLTDKIWGEGWLIMAMANSH